MNLEVDFPLKYFFGCIQLCRSRINPRVILDWPSIVIGSSKGDCNHRNDIISVPGLVESNKSD